MYNGGLVTIMVADFDRAVRFYTETLGLALKMRAGDGWAEVDAPGVHIGLHAAGPHGPRPGPSGGVSIGLQVENLEGAMATLQARGVEFGQVTPGQGLRFAFFADPDGTALYLCAAEQPPEHQAREQK